MPYIIIVPPISEEKLVPRGVVDNLSHFFLVKNYIPKAGILVTREGVTEFAFS